MSAAFSPAGLVRMRRVMAGHAGGRMPGLVTLVSRRGETHVEAHGVTAFGGDVPMRRDTIFRIASMTKLVTAAAAMMLVEECVLRLDDPVDDLLPELVDRRVLRAIDSELDDTVPAERSISLRDLLTFRAGIGAVMGEPGRFPIQHAMDDLGVSAGPRNPDMEPDEFLRRLGQLPLLHQPGERWTYNTGSDILGVLIGRATGGSLGAFLRERVFDHLGMTDTGFWVPPEEINRLPPSYAADHGGDVAEFDAGGAASQLASPPTFESGAGGLVSTADDLLAFGEMLLGGGRRGDVRVLSRASIELMMTDHITAEQKAASPFEPGFWESSGWGFGMAVDTARTDLATRPGRVGWEGGIGTSFHVDPSEGMIGALLTQRAFWDAPEAGTVLSDFWTTAYAAIDD